MAAIRDIKLAIEGADWEELLPTLIAYTRLKMSRVYWRGIYGGTPPGGWEVKDFIQEAIIKALDGRREWNQEETLLEFIKGIISSDVSNRAHLYENINGKRATTSTDESDSNTIDISAFKDKLIPSASSLVEEREARNLIVSQLDESIDREIVKLVIDEGFEHPREVAERLNIPVREVNNAQRRLRRKRHQLLGTETALACIRCSSVH